PAAAYARALDQVMREGAAFLPWLGAADTARLLQSCAEGLTYRAARPLVGTAGREVRQDFELTMEIPPAHPLRAVARQLTAATLAALESMTPNPLPQGLEFNDLIVQRYAPGSAGITPHRDHLRYVGLV